MLMSICSTLASAYTGDNYPWRITMKGTCWTNVSCTRAMIVSHGGDWDPIVFPYDSLPAFQKAYTDGAEAVKGDFRVSSDNVGVIMHSSPVEFYESLDCVGKLVENMTVAQCTSCKMALTNYTFLSLPELLSWSRGNVIVMLCVKRNEDIARAISSVVELSATDRVFLEIGVDALIEYVWKAKPPGWESVYYVAEGGSAADITTVLSQSFAPLLPMAFMFEFDPSYPQWGINLTQSIAQLHGHGLRTLTATTEFLPSVDSHVALFNEGFDVVYTYDTQNAVAARVLVNQARGVLPP